MGINKNNMDKFKRLNLVEWIEESGCTGENVTFATRENIYNVQDEDSHSIIVVEAFKEVLPRANLFDVPYTKNIKSLQGFIEDCIRAKVDIILCSWWEELTAKGFEVYCNAMKLARENGIAFIVAAGNADRKGGWDNRNGFNYTASPDVSVIAEIGKYTNSNEYFTMGNIGNIDYSCFGGMYITKYDMAWSGSSFAVPLYASLLGLMLDYNRSNNLQAESAYSIKNKLEIELIGPYEEFGEGLAKLPDINEYNKLYN